MRFSAWEDTGTATIFPWSSTTGTWRIHPIHEGDYRHSEHHLAWERCITMKNGKAFQLFLEEVQETINTAQVDTDLAVYAGELAQAAEETERSKRTI